MRLFSKWMVTMGAVALLVGPVAAQQGGGGRGGRGGPGGGQPRLTNILDLLTNPQVQKELGISQEEVAAKLPDAVMEALGKVLKPEQVKRLREINLQQMAARGAAFSDPKVQQELNLTGDQKKEIKTIQDDAQKERRELFQGGGGGGGDRQEAAAKMQKLNEETEKKVQSVLTSEQKAKWKDLVGTPFKMERQQRGGQGRRQRQDP